MSSEYQLLRPDSEEFHIWTEDQIYTGDNNYISMYRGGVVPNPGDMVTHFVGAEGYDAEGVIVSGGDFYFSKVHSVDSVTLLSTLVPVTQARVAVEGESTELFAGMGAGRVTDADRLYVNENNLRYPFNVDGRIRSYGSNVSYYKIFLGSDLTDDNNVISVNYDINGNPIGNNLGVELVDSSNPDKLVYCPTDGNLNRLPKEGEQVTIVAYSDKGVPRYWQPLIVYYSAMVADVNAYTNYITGIHLESPYLVAGEDNTLQVPINFLNSSLITSAYVNYKDGSKRKVTIGTEGMALRGWNQFSGGSWAGQVRNLILTYELGEGETAPIVEGGGETPHLAVTYKVTVLPANSAYNIKVFADIVYLNETAGYDVRYFAMNLERNLYVDVTSLINYGSSGTGPFQPKAYNVVQTLPIRLQLQDIDPEFAEYLYTQAIEVTLKSPPAINQTPYLLNYIEGSSRPYGEGIQFTYRTETDNTLLLDISSGITQYADWIDQFYYKLLPMYDESSESNAPVPTKLRITYSGKSIVVDTVNYMIEVDITEMGVPSEGELVYLEWFTLDGSLNEQMLARATAFIYGS